jgi:hypothetical protein
MDGAAVPMKYKVRRLDGEPVPMSVLQAAGDDRHDPDTRPGPDVLERMLAAARRRRGGLVK